MARDGEIIQRQHFCHYGDKSGCNNNAIFSDRVFSRFLPSQYACRPRATKTEHLSTRENPMPMKVNGEELKNVDHLIQVPGIGDRVDTDRTIDRDVDLRVRAAWSSWRNIDRSNV